MLSRSKNTFDALAAARVLCRCEYCAPDAPGATFTRKYMRECEVRFIAAMRTNLRRRDYIRGVEAHRGALVTTDLRNAVRRLMGL